MGFLKKIAKWCKRFTFTTSRKKTLSQIPVEPSETKAPENTAEAVFNYGSIKDLMTMTKKRPNQED